MSLINQMLQDLDARREAHGVGVKLPNDVRPLPPAQPSRLPWVLAALGAVAVAAMGAYLVLHEPVAPPPAVPAAPPVAAPAPPVAAEAVAVPDPVAENVPPPPAPEASGSLRLDEAFSAAEQRSAAKPAPAQNDVAKRPADVKRVEDKPEPAHRDKPADAAPAPVAETRTAKNASIEKTEAAVPPRDRAEATYRKAIAAVNQGRVNEALETLQDVLRSDSLHVASRQLLVKLLLEARRVDEAMQAMQDGLREQPAQTAWAMSLARLQVDRGDIAGAAQTLQHSLPAAFGNPDYLGFAGHLQQRLGHGKEAADLYQAAARVAPNDGRWWLGLGLAMESEGRNEQALAAFQRARQCGNLSRELAAFVEQRLRQ